MATPTIPNGEEQFFPIIYEGNGGGQRVGKFVPFTDNGTIANSVIFNDGDSAYMSRTAGSSPTSTRQFTISLWVKLGVLGTTRTLLGLAEVSGSTQRPVLNMNSSNQLQFVTSGGSAVNKVSNRTFEDTSKFYHILISVDTTQSTADNRNRIYVDGDEITSFATNTNPSQNSDYQLASQTQNIGRLSSSGQYFDGYLAEVNYVDGQALLPASFGVTDTSTGRWIPKTVSPYPTTTTTFTVTVSNPGSGNVYYIDSSQQATVTLIEGATYRFDQSDSSNSGHPLRFSTTSDGTHGGGTEFTSGVTTAGTPGSSGAYTEITVPVGTATLYYYCSSHSGMGGTANTQDQYGTNGFRLKFQDSSALGDDTSGNTNDFTATNLASTDQTTDSPTQNFATLQGTGGTLSEGNLKLATGTSDYSHHNATLKPKSGKYYAEFTCDSMGRSEVGVVSTLNVPYSSNSTRLPATSDGSVAGYMYYGFNGQVYYNSSNSYDVTYATYTSTDIIGIALDLDNHTVQFFKNNSSQGTISLPNGNYTFAMGDGATGHSGGWTANFGQKSFTYTPPTGFSALQQDNLPETAKGISGLVWIKDRDAVRNHNLFDSSRGKHKELRSNSTDQEFTNADTLQKFLKGGCSVEDGTSVNNSGNSYVSWNWVANGGTTATNDDGSQTSTTQANTLAGFSIVTYAGTSSGTATIGHGLSSTPQWIMIKNLTDSRSWFVYHKDLSGANYYVSLNSNSAQSTSDVFNNTAPTSSVFSIQDAGSLNTNGSGKNYVAYCWHEVDGFSKFGSYTGNGSSDGTFVATNFSPSFVMIKRTDSSGNWVILDNKRNTFNPVDLQLVANSTGADATGVDYLDFLANGFKQRSTNTSFNASGGTYIYMAFAEHPFVGDGTNPVTAR